MGDYPTWKEFREEIAIHESRCEELRNFVLDTRLSEYMKNLTPGKVVAFFSSFAGAFLIGITIIFHSINAQDRIDIQRVESEVKNNKEQIAELKADLKGATDKITQAIDAQTREVKALREDLPYYER